MNGLRIGNGFDVHPFIYGRALVLGGKTIDFKFGLDGHSDADVLVHAIIDALLGAAGMPDIGHLFPDHDNRYKNIRSLVLLEEVGKKLNAANFRVINIDSILICQEPKVSPHVDEIKKNISTALNMDASRISVKGKTTEGLGFTGRGEGIASYAVALLEVV